MKNDRKIKSIIAFFNEGLTLNNIKNSGMKKDMEICTRAAIIKMEAADSFFSFINRCTPQTKRITEKPNLTPEMVISSSKSRNNIQNR